MLIGGGTLALGLFAVFGAIFYRIATSDTSEAPLPPGAAVPTVARAALGVPADATLVSVAVGEGRIVLGYRHAGGESVVVLDDETYAPVGRVDVVAGD